MTDAQATVDPRRWQALALVCVAFFMTVLDVSIVNVALPSIKTSFNVSDQTLQWVLIAYTITFGGFLLLGGRAADLLGRRRVFMAGVALFSVAALACGLAGSIGVLIAAPKPCTARAATSTVVDPARPQTSEAIVKIVTPMRNIRLRPRMSPARPPSSRKPPNVIA